MSIFSKENRERLTDLLEAEFDERSAWLSGQYLGYIEGGMSERRALKRTRRDFFELVIDELDTAVTWDRVKRREVRNILEAIDGFVFEALFSGLLNLASARITGTGTGFSDLLALADGAIDAAQEAAEASKPRRPGPTLRERIPPASIPSWAAVDSAEFEPDEPDEPDPAPVIEASATTVKGRLQDLLRRDRAVLRDEPEDDTDEEPDPNDDPAGLPAAPTSSRLTGMGGSFLEKLSGRGQK
tara:strand:+ start:183 stop:908 length:726 start_codon:yes stop_codon:yes gene_type:complete